MTLKNNRAPLLSIIKLYASFHHHMWIKTGVTVRKRLSWVLTSVTLTFDLWPWPFAWTSFLSLVITPENFMMIRWWEHGEKGVTDGRTDGQTDRQTDGLNQSYSCLVAAKKKRCGLRTSWSFYKERPLRRAYKLCDRLIALSNRNADFHLICTSVRFWKLQIISLAQSLTVVQHGMVKHRSALRKIITLY